jgi:DNA replication and repair protein RecF
MNDKKIFLLTITVKINDINIYWRFLLAFINILDKFTAQIILENIMHIQKLSLVNFKNFEEITLSLHQKLNCFVGNNGEGKTNLLDSIYYLCMCKSYFNSTDLYSIRYDEDFMLLQGDFMREGKTEELYCGLHRTKKKQFRRNKKEYTKLSDHIGLFPVVMVSPADIELITGGSEERRKYVNSVIAQFDRNYLDNQINYNKVLAQRNRLLKSSDRKNSMNDLLDIFDEQLIGFCNEIYKVRDEFIGKFTPVFNKFYQFISEGNEEVELIYQSQLHKGNFANQLRESRDRDLAVQYTTVGIHKDDLILNLNGTHIKLTGSQGQQKTYLVSLKLAQFDFMKEVNIIQPLLILDDIFDKFDANRVRQILKLVADEAFGQIFITHTNLDRMNDILKELKIDHKLFFVSKGNVEERKDL